MSNTTKYKQATTLLIISREKGDKEAYVECGVCIKTGQEIVLQQNTLSWYINYCGAKFDESMGWCLYE